MRTSTATAELAVVASPRDQEIRSHLARILASPEFAGAPRLSRFLEFIVETALSGLSKQIEESLIAVEVYNRRPDYNPQIDSTVRVEAGRLRARLRRFYDASGQTEALQIELPPGAYVPVFRTVRTSNALCETAEIPRSCSPRASAVFKRRIFGTAGFVGSCADL
jgi:hypothetical protein